MIEHNGGYDEADCQEFILTGRCGHSDVEHDAMADRPSEGYLVLDSTVYSAVLQGTTVIASNSPAHE